jgi:hypothetical protein
MHVKENGLLVALPAEAGQAVIPGGGSLQKNEYPRPKAKLWDF